MSKMNVKTGDTVIVISGEGRKQKDKPAKKGKVQKVFPETGRIIVEGVNIVKKHQKPRGQGMPGGIVEREAAIDASNVMLVCKKCGRPARYGWKVNADGSKTRICKKCHEQID